MQIGVTPNCPDDHFPYMLAICAWCRALLSPAGESSGPVSHGLCAACRDAQMAAVPAHPPIAAPTARSH
ncbi:MAG: hypothetical protein HRU02_08260 [Myxococcales bacterium]|nr:hypothetical protein [Myxococcales bacterium]